MNGGYTMSKVPPSQERWKHENVVVVKCDINRNQDPELFDFFVNAEGSRGTHARELLREALAARKAAEK